MGTNKCRARIPATCTNPRCPQRYSHLGAAIRQDITQQATNLKNDLAPEQHSARLTEIFASLDTRLNLACAEIAALPTDFQATPTDYAAILNHQLYPPIGWLHSELDHLTPAYRTGQTYHAVQQFKQAIISWTIAKTR